MLHYLSIVCFILFGCKMLYEVRGLFLNVNDDGDSSSHADLEADLTNEDNQRRNRRWHTLGFATSFSMTLMAEWGKTSTLLIKLFALSILRLWKYYRMPICPILDPVAYLGLEAPGASSTAPYREEKITSLDALVRNFHVFNAVVKNCGPFWKIQS